MSLIQQALEKTGKTGTQTISLDTFLKKPTEKLPPKLPAEKPKTKSSADYRVRSLIVTMVVLFVMLQAGIVYYFWVSPNHSASKTSATMKQIAGPQTAVLAQTAVALPVSFIPKPKLTPSFVLTGISQSGTEKFAILNNKVLGIGEEVSKNVTVVDILPEKKTVILRDDGREISLKL